MALDSRVGLQLSTVTYKDKGVKRKVMYEGNLGGMVVPYGDPDIGWYFKSYLDSGEYGMGTLTSSIIPGTDAPDNAVLLDAVIADYKGQPQVIPNAIAVFERYAGPEYKHHEILVTKMPVKHAVNLSCAGLVRLETTITCLTGYFPKMV